MTQSTVLHDLPGPENAIRSQETGAKKQDVIKKYALIILSVLFIASLIGLVVVSIQPHQCNQYVCPDEWIGFQDNCHYFSIDEKNWTSSRNYCLTEHADLTVIDNTTHVMGFLKRYKGTSDRWIGLEMEGNKMGKWVNGTTLDRSFIVSGNETCAYLNDDGVATARCYTERKFICRKKKSLVRRDKEELSPGAI